MLHWEPGNKQLFNCFVRNIGIFSSALELKLLSVGLGTLFISWEEGMNMTSESQSVVCNCHKLILPPVWSEQRRRKSEMCWGQCLSFFCAQGMHRLTHTQNTHTEGYFYRFHFNIQVTPSYFRYLHFCSAAENAAVCGQAHTEGNIPVHWGTATEMEVYIRVCVHFQKHLLGFVVQPATAHSYQSPKQTQWKGWGRRDDIAQSSSFGHVHPLGFCFLRAASGAVLCSRFPCFILFNILQKLGFPKASSYFLAPKTIAFSREVSPGFLSDFELFTSFGIVKLGLLLRQRTWPLQLVKETQFLKDLTVAVLWVFNTYFGHPSSFCILTESCFCKRQNPIRFLWDTVSPVTAITHWWLWETTAKPTLQKKNECLHLLWTKSTPSWCLCNTNKNVHFWKKIMNSCL